jgi:hypothetical protein
MRCLSLPIAIILFVLSTVVVGCGSSDRSFVADSGTPSNSQAVTGSVVLGRYVSGGSAVLETLDGEPLAQTAISPTGGFIFVSVPLPNQFRVRATLAGAEVSFFADVERSDQGNHVRISVPSSLASLNRLANPGLTLAQSEDQVRRVLGLPSAVDLNSGLAESARSPFSHLAFFVEASAAGGWDSFSAALLSEMSGVSAQGTSQLHRFRAERSDLSAPLQGVEQGLEEHAIALQGYRPLVLSLVGDAAKTVLGFVGKSVGKSVLSEVIDGGVKAAWTAIAEHFGLNFGTQVALQEIEQELGELIDDLAAIETELSDAEYQNAANALSASIAYLQTLSEVKTSKPGSSDGTFALAMNEAETDGLPSSQPISAPSGQSNIGKLLAQVEAFETVVDLEEIADYQLPGAAVVNMNELWRQNKVDTPLAVQADARFMRMPFRSNSWMDVALTNFNFYGGYQQLGAKWLADNARQGTNPANDTANAASQVDRVAVSLKSQRGQFPAYLPSDEVIVDLQFGIMWYATMQAPQTASAAKTWAEQLCVTGDALGQSVVYDDWRLPCYNELKALQDRGRFCADVPPNTGIVPLSSGLPYGDRGTSTVGLAGLGFEGVADALNSKDNGGNAKDGGMWFESYTQYDGQWNQEGPAELELNHTQKINRKNSSDKRPFLVCRSIDRPVVNAQDPSQPNQDPTEVESTFPSQLTPNPVAPAELPGLGVPTAVAIVSGTQSQLNATVTYTLYLGGDFQTGSDISSASQRTYAYSAQFDVPVSTSGSSEAPEFNALVLVPWFTSSNALLVPSNYPPAYDPKGSEIFPEALNSFGSSGFFFKFTDDPAPINATLLASVQGYVESTDAFPVVLTGSADAAQTGAYDDGLTRQPDVLQISPRNRVYDSTSPLLSGGVISERYSSSLFYKNLTVSSETASVEWRLLDDQGERYTGSAARLNGRLGPDPGLLELDLSQISSSGETFSIQAELTLGSGASAVTLTDRVSFLVNGTLSATD